MDDDSLSLPYLSPRRIVALLAEHRGPMIASAAIEVLLDQASGTPEVAIMRAQFGVALVQVQADRGNLHPDEKLHLLQLLVDEVVHLRGLEVPGFAEAHAKQLGVFINAMEGKDTPGWKDDSELNWYRDVLNKLRAEFLTELNEPDLAHLWIDNVDEFLDRSRSGEALLLRASQSQN